MTSALRKKLLSLAIRGKLVPQDAADEPASVLLERIRAERESKENAAPRRGRGHRSSSDNPPCPKRGTSAGTTGAEGAVFEPPFPIPESWAWCSLKDICDIARGGSPRPINAFLTTEENGINWIKIGDARPGSKYISEVREKIKPEGLRKTRRVHKGDLLLTNSMSFGHPYILQVDGCIHDGWLVLHPLSEMIDKEYLCLFLQSPEAFETFSISASGGVVQNLNSQKVERVSFALPPFSEQQRIVKRFDALSALCDAIDIQSVSLSVLAEQVKKKVLDLAIRGLLVSQNPTDEPASTLLDRIRSTADKPPCPKNGKKTEPIGISDPLFPIPESWEWTTLGEIGEVVRGTGIKRSDMSEIGRPCVRYGEIYTTYSLKTEKVVSFVSEELFRSSKHVQARSVLMTLTGEDRKDIAKTIAYLGDEPIAISGDMLGICPREVEPLYLSFVLNSPWAIERKGKLATGDLVIHISQKSMSWFPVPLPPLAEQRRIVAKVEELFSAIDAMATK